MAYIRGWATEQRYRSTIHYIQQLYSRKCLPDSQLARWRLTRFEAVDFDGLPVRQAQSHLCARLKPSPHHDEGGVQTERDETLRWANQRDSWPALRLSFTTARSSGDQKRKKGRVHHLAARGYSPSLAHRIPRRRFSWSRGIAGRSLFSARVSHQREGIHRRTVSKGGSFSGAGALRRL